MEESTSARSHKKNIIIFILLIIFASLLFYIFRSYTYVNVYYEKEEIKSVTIILSDIKAGLERSQEKSVLITDENKINELIEILEDKRIIRLFPKMGGAESISKDRFEMRILVASDKHRNLEYYLTSTGQLSVKKGNDKFAKSVIINGEVTKLFTKLTPFVS